MFQPLNSSQSSKMMLCAAGGVKAAASQAGSRGTRCLIILEVSACYVESAASADLLGVGVWFVDNAALPSFQACVWQEFRVHRLCNSWRFGKGSSAYLFGMCIAMPDTVLPACCPQPDVLVRKFTFPLITWKGAQCSVMCWGPWQWLHSCVLFLRSS